MENVSAQIQKLLETFTVNLINSITFVEVDNQEYEPLKKNDEQKKLKKKFKKCSVEEGDSIQKAHLKMNKILDELYKNYEITCKSYEKTEQLKGVVSQSKLQRDKSLDQKKMIEQLYNGFRNRYEEEMKKAQTIQKDEQQKTQVMINELQNRIKEIQTKYEEAGKIKIEKYRQNQTLKHESLKLQPHLVASQSLYDAQLNKKAIENEISMTTLKQKIQMMDNFKNMKADTQEKLNTSTKIEEKINKRIVKLESKEEEHKIALAKAHLVFEDYKKAIGVLKDLLPKKQKQMFLLKKKTNENQSTLQEIQKKIKQLENEYNSHYKQFEVLKTLEQNLKKQLQVQN